jgi:hypothetical protein
MSATPQVKRNPLGTLWLAVRFVLFGVGGFAAVWISWLSLVFTFDPPPERLLNPLAAIALGLAGAVMMLYGGGKWGRWAYLWVFVSVPLVVTPIGLLSAKYPAVDWLFAKPVAILLVALPMPVSYLLVKRYYAKKDARATQ